MSQENTKLGNCRLTTKGRVQELVIGDPIFDPEHTRKFPLRNHRKDKIYCETSKCEILCSNVTYDPVVV